MIGNEAPLAGDLVDNDLSDSARLMLSDASAAALRCDFGATEERVDGDATVTDAERARVIEILNATALAAVGREWTSHKILRSFRYWSDAEKLQYLTTAVTLMRELSNLTGMVSLGFGTVLGLVRDNSFIPHDDDVDILVGFPIERAPNFRTGKQAVERHLLAAGYEIENNPNFHAHLKARIAGSEFVDIFVGLKEGPVVSWYPGPHRRLLAEKLFPAKEVPFFGVNCPIPRDETYYLAEVYGPDWRTPIARWQHQYSTGKFLRKLDGRFLLRKALAMGWSALGSKRGFRRARQSLAAKILPKN